MLLDRNQTRKLHLKWPSYNGRPLLVSDVLGLTAVRASRITRVLASPVSVLWSWFYLHDIGILHLTCTKATCLTLGYAIVCKPCVILSEERCVTTYFTKGSAYISFHLCTGWNILYGGTPTIARLSVKTYDVVKPEVLLLQGLPFFVPKFLSFLIWFVIFINYFTWQKQNKTPHE